MRLLVNLKSLAPIVSDHVRDEGASAGLEPGWIRTIHPGVEPGPGIPSCSLDGCLVQPGDGEAPCTAVEGTSVAA